MNDNSYLRRWFLILFALFCVGINVVAFVLYEKNQEINISKQWVQHTYEVMNETYNLFSTIQDIETAQRGYLLTGEGRFLEAYPTSKSKVEDSLTVIQDLTKDNPERQKDLAQYREYVTSLFTVLETESRAREEGRVQDINLDDNRAYMQAIREVHAKIIDGEEQKLIQRQNDEARRQKNYVSTLFFAAGLSAIGLLLANIFVALLTYRRKVAEENLNRTNKEMEGFTYIASHDLRSPLVNLKGFATEMRYSVEELSPLLEKASGGLSEDEKKKVKEIVEKDIPDSLHYIHSSVEKMDKLTNAILELSRLGRRSMDFKPVDTRAVVSHVLDTLHHTITEKKINIHLHNLPVVVADQLSMEQVFGNIIDNAIKYLDPNRRGEIEIGAVKTYRETKFWVKDNGRGIASGDSQKIFEIYRRAGNTEAIPGEGMGMAYVRTTLRRLGGQIWCESTPGEGTTFYFTISNSLKKDR